MAFILTKEAVPGNGTTTTCIPPGLTKACVLGGRLVCRTASTAAATINVQKGSTVVATFTMPAGAGANTVVTAVRNASNGATQFSAASNVSLVAHASLASKTFDVHLIFDENAVTRV